MPRATKPPSSPQVMSATEPISLPCKFGNVVLGPDKCSISVQTERNSAKLAQTESLLVGARLDVHITIDPIGQDDVPGQKRAVNTDITFESVADCPSLMVKPKKFGFRLSFATGSVDVARLATVAQMSGQVELQRIGDSGEDNEE
jgi:hypothetical protein